MDTEVDTVLTKGRIVLALLGRKDDVRDTSVAPMRRVQFVRQFPGSLATLVIADDAGGASVARLDARLDMLVERSSMQVMTPEARAPRSSSLPTLIASGLASAILSETGKTLPQLRAWALQDTGFAPVALNQTSLAVDLPRSREVKTTENVVGFLEGSDPKLKEEVVVFTAHYDHVGLGAGGSIYYGADDDGSGTVTVIELAQAFAANPVRPKRSLVFMTVVGEEKGLWGSDWYVKHPIIPLEKTVADLNTDMIGRMDKKYEELKNPNYVYVIGSDKISTQLDSLLKLSNKESENITLDYTYNDDKDPNQFYRRSDHYKFAERGIPVVFFFTGVHDDYHKVTDTVDKILFERMERIVRLIYYTGWKIANNKRGLAKNVGSTMFGK
jgi:Zn-dependent M28 family amino/carboxypeptidase